jgi:hypothetical protein
MTLRKFGWPFSFHFLFTCNINPTVNYPGTISRETGFISNSC